MNPIHTGLANHLDDYRWSSHHCYSGKVVCEWVNTDLVLRAVENSFSDYHNYMSKRQGIAQTLLDVMSSQDKVFDEDIVNKKAHLRKELTLHHLSFEEISAVVCEQMKLPPEAICSVSHRKEIVFARSMIAYFSHYHGRYYLKDLAVLLDRNAEVLSRTMHQNLRKIREDKVLRRIFCQLQQKFSEK